MLRIYLFKHPEEHPFPKSNIMGQMWRDFRGKAAKNLCKPELKNIPLKNLRNYSGAQLYYRLPDPINVMRHLRHKKLETTMHYIRGITIRGEAEWVCKVAKTTEERVKLIEEGFTLVEKDGDVSLYRKLKT